QVRLNPAERYINPGFVLADPACGPGRELEISIVALAGEADGARRLGTQGAVLVRFRHLLSQIRASDIARKRASKIIQGDWPWHPNRPVGDQRSVWKNYQGQRREEYVFWRRPHRLVQIASPHGHAPTRRSQLHLVVTPLNPTRFHYGGATL